MNTCPWFWLHSFGFLFALRWILLLPFIVWKSLVPSDLCDLLNIPTSVRELWSTNHSLDVPRFRDDWIKPVDCYFFAFWLRPRFLNLWLRTICTCLILIPAEFEIILELMFFMLCFCIFNYFWTFLFLLLFHPFIWLICETLWSTYAVFLCWKNKLKSTLIVLYESYTLCYIALSVIF